MKFYFLRFSFSLIFKICKDAVYFIPFLFILSEMFEFFFSKDFVYFFLKLVEKMKEKCMTKTNLMIH